MLSTAAYAALDGLASVLPLSASGHRFVARVWLGSVPGLEAIGQLTRVGVVLALVFVVWRRLTDALAEGIRGLSRPAVLQRSSAGRDAVALILATVTAAGTELLLLPLASPLNDNWIVVGAGLALTAAAVGSTALAPAPRHTCPTASGALLAGVAYGMAVLPGSSPVAMAFVVFRWLGVTSFNAVELTLATSVPVLALGLARDLFAADPSPSLVGGGELALAAVIAFSAALLGAAIWRWLAHRERSAWLALWLSSLALAVMAYGRALPQPALPEQLARTGVTGTAGSRVTWTPARRCPMCVA